MRKNINGEKLKNSLKHSIQECRTTIRLNDADNLADKSAPSRRIRERENWSLSIRAYELEKVIDKIDAMMNWK